MNQHLTKQKTLKTKYLRKILVRILVISLVLPISWMVGVPVSFAAERAITTNPSLQEAPTIYGDKVVWVDYRNDNLSNENTDIYIYDLSTDTETQITSISTARYSPDIYEDKIVWTDNRNGNHDIYMYDLSTRTETQITTNPSGQTASSIYEDKIVWLDKRNGNHDIYMYDLNTRTETRITSNSYLYLSVPKIYRNKIVWTDNRNGNHNIYMYDLDTKTEIPITSNASSQYNPVIYEDKIVWSDDRYGNSDIYMYDLSTEIETQITKDSKEQQHPSIYGDKIVWTDYRNGNSDIYMYNLSTKAETRITSNSSDQYVPTIHEDKIVWQDDRNGWYNPNIYMYNLKETPVTTHLLNPSSPPSNGWYHSNVSISLSATPSAVKTEYRINGGSWTVYTGPFTLSAEGTNKVEYRSTDQDNNIEPIKSVQVKIDKTAPTLNVQLNKSILPINNKLIPIQAQVSANDTTSGLSSWKLTSITSSVRNTNDIFGAQLNTSDTSFSLRAETSSRLRRFRVYNITYIATDLAGNKTTITKQVVVR